MYIYTSYTLDVNAIYMCIIHIYRFIIISFTCVYIHYVTKSVYNHIYKSIKKYKIKILKKYYE